MANRLTRVPSTPVPPLGRERVLLPLADAFMLLMLSRPSTGSLRVTWVTPATLALCAATAVLSAGACAAALLAGRAGPLGVWAVLLATVAAGAAAVAVVAVAQRLRASAGRRARPESRSRR